MKRVPAKTVLRAAAAVVVAAAATVAAVAAVGVVAVVMAAVAEAVGVVVAAMAAAAEAVAAVVAGAAAGNAAAATKGQTPSTAEFFSAARSHFRAAFFCAVTVEDARNSPGCRPRTAAERMGGKLELTDELEVPDERLRLIFTCCHPSLAPAAQVALALRHICGLTTRFGNQHPSDRRHKRNPGSAP